MDCVEALKQIRGDEIPIYYVNLLDQDFLSTISLVDPCIIICDKQKKLKNPMELLDHIEIHNTKEIRRSLKPNKFIPRFSRADPIDFKAHIEYLPHILKTDPMVRIHGFKVNDIIKIERLDGSIYYRRVV
jgi:hypothetical protein